VLSCYELRHGRDGVTGLRWRAFRTTHPLFGPNMGEQLEEMGRSGNRGQTCLNNIYIWYIYITGLRLQQNMLPKPLTKGITVGICLKSVKKRHYQIHVISCQIFSWKSPKRHHVFRLFV
jgi:hypothetical protein